ncbi:hypothetical protein ABGT15_04205 [Flavobacterium enshiense]|uniref:hypothetical protein n=1 Tax=Flavobacterium enshiense TaxID=1341165 RepID=UPI00345D580E
MKRNLQKLGLVLVASLAMLSCSKEGMGYEDNPVDNGSGVTPPGLNCNGSCKKIRIQTYRGGQDTLSVVTTYDLRSTYTTQGYDIQCGEKKEYINQAPIGQVDEGGWIKTVRIIDCR